MSTGLGPYVGTDATDSDDTGAGSPVIETTLDRLSEDRRHRRRGSWRTRRSSTERSRAPHFGSRSATRWSSGWSTISLIRLGIHWHGLELENYSDGTEITQNAVPGAPLQVLGNGVPAGGTFLYKFKVPRAGLFWYHPHHHNSLNQVFRGMYGMIIVTDPLEASLVGGVLPAAADTMQLVLSDITVCKGVGSTDPTYLANYDQILRRYCRWPDRPEWLSGRTDQVGPAPISLCEVARPQRQAARQTITAPRLPLITLPVTFRALSGAAGRLTEGQTVLTNGVNVGGRLGTPSAPGALMSRRC